MKISHELQELGGVMEFLESHFDKFTRVKDHRDYSVFVVSHKDIKTNEICPIIGYDEKGDYKIERYD